jgi:PRTRC genetic system protein C
MPETNNTTASVKRRFVFNGMVLDDPDPGMTPMKVAEFYSLLRAELTNVTVKGPTRTADGFDEYKFTAQVGTFN